MHKEEPTPTTQQINLIQLQAQEALQKICVSAKVVEEDDVVTIGDGRKVKNIMIADSTGTAEVALWGDYIDEVELSRTYEFQNLTVKSFRDFNTLFTPRQGVCIQKMDDFKEICSPHDSIKKNKSLSNSKVIAVSSFKSITLCFSCNEGSVSAVPNSTLLGKCSSCSSMVMLQNCKLQVSATLTIFANLFQHRLIAGGRYLAAIADQPLQDISEQDLILAPHFDAMYMNGKITGVTRAQEDDQ